MKIPPDAQNTGSLREEPSGNGVKSLFPDPIHPPTPNPSQPASQGPSNHRDEPLSASAASRLGKTNGRPLAAGRQLLSAKPWSSQLSGGKGNRSRPNSRALERSQKQRDTSERLGLQNNFPSTTPRRLHSTSKDFNEGNIAATTRSFG